MCICENVHCVYVYMGTMQLQDLHNSSTESAARLLLSAFDKCNNFVTLDHLHCSDIYTLLTVDAYMHVRVCMHDASKSPLE
jgi:hypothetical protein